MQIGLTHVNKFVRYPATKRNRETVIPTIQSKDLPSTQRPAINTAPPQTPLAFIVSAIEIKET